MPLSRVSLASEWYDDEGLPRALRCRFWSSILAGEWLYNRWGIVWGWWEEHGARVRQLEEHKKSAVFALLSEMEKHKAMLLADIFVQR